MVQWYSSEKTKWGEFRTFVSSERGPAGGGRSAPCGRSHPPPRHAARRFPVLSSPSAAVLQRFDESTN